MMSKIVGGGGMRSLAILSSLALLASVASAGKVDDCKDDVKKPSSQSVKRVDGCTPATAPTAGQPYFSTCDPTFDTITGGTPSFTLALNDTVPYYHEAGVYIPSQDALFVSSNQYVPTDNSTGGNKTIVISKLQRTTNPHAINKHAGHWTRSTIHPNPDIPLPNGAVNYKDGVLFCAQGDESGHPSGLTLMTTSEPYTTTPLLDSFDGKREFNSPNDVVVLPADGSIWFTDPSYAFEQGVRPQTQLPNRVYRFDPVDKSVIVVAEGFVKPNGIAFSPDHKIVYVTDTGRFSGDGVEHPDLPAAIYAFDLNPTNPTPLSNRRLFARATKGIPDGLKVDTRGNVYAGCGDGVEVWGPHGKLLGKMVVPEDGVANFAFGRPGEMFLLNEGKMWVVRVAGETVGDILGVV